MAKEGIEAVYDRISQDRNMRNQLANGKLPELIIKKSSLNSSDIDALEIAADVARRYFDDHHLIYGKHLLLNMLLTFGVSLNAYILRTY